MRKGLWIIVGMALLGTALLAAMGRSLVGTVTGVEEALGLQEGLRAVHGVHFVPEPPLRVLLQPGPRGEGPRPWKWKVEATLRDGADPASPVLERAIQRIVFSCFETRVQARQPDGVTLLFHRPGLPDWERTFGRPGAPAVPGSPPPEAPK